MFPLLDIEAVSCSVCLQTRTHARVPYVERRPDNDTVTNTVLNANNALPTSIVSIVTNCQRMKSRKFDVVLRQCLSFCVRVTASCT